MGLPYGPERPQNPAARSTVLRLDHRGTSDRFVGDYPSVRTNSEANLAGGSSSGVTVGATFALAAPPICRTGYRRAYSSAALVSNSNATKRSSPTTDAS
jgi:hypothetical protein